MSIRDLVLQSQLIPPTQRKGLLNRSRLVEQLSSVFEFPLTIVYAGTGHSKTTTMASFAATVDHLFWYSITEPDRDPLLFLAHLISAFNQRGYELGAHALDALEANGGRVHLGALTPLLNAITTGLSEQAVLVIDDYHIVAGIPEIDQLVERLVDYAPPQLHIVLSSRQLPPFSCMTRWRAKNQVLIIKRNDLAFTSEEIDTLFREQYGVPLSNAQVQALELETEGWAIALQIIWQSLQTGVVSSIEGVLARLPETLEGLFNYLAQEVLDRQPPEIQRFLLTTSVLRELTGPACDALLETTGSEKMLSQLLERGLFLSSLGDHVYRYQHLFHDFLYLRLKQDPACAEKLHLRAAEYFERKSHPEETIYHLLEAGDYLQAAVRIEAIGPQLIAISRLDSLSGWILQLPSALVESSPGLHLLSGDIFRLRSRFDDALESFTVAEKLYLSQGNNLGRSRALRGQAQVYLDTIRPIKADSLLESALRMLDPNLERQEMAGLLEQLAENRLNLGHPDQAEAFHHEAQLLRVEELPADIFLEGRALLRTGRLQDARRLLEERAESERTDRTARPQRFHREVLPLLSLICSFLGDALAAESYAREGIRMGRRLESAFVEAVGYMRLGHPLLLNGLRPWNDHQRKEAIEAYERAVDMARPFRVNRIAVEPLWGLCRAYGLKGDLQAAENFANQALEISRQSGDEWIGNLVRISMGASLVQAFQHQKAYEWLQQAYQGFTLVGDVHGEAAALLWLAINEARQGQQAESARITEKMLSTVSANGLDFLLTHPTHIGLTDDQAVFPLLLSVRELNLSPEADLLLQQKGFADLDYHPGYTLYVRALGPFEVWRGDQPVRQHEWQREKARQLFQLFITERGRWMTREQIADRLWPHLDADAAARDFKSALNAMNRAIEPARPQGAQPFFIIRRDNLYGINPKARITLDVDDFETWAASKSSYGLQQALWLYQQDFLNDSTGDEWSLTLRDRLHETYLMAAERLANLLVEERSYEEAVRICQDMIAHDRCWEGAYRLLMEVYSALGSRPQVQSTYNRLVATLADELDVEPSQETTDLLKRLLAD